MKYLKVYFVKLKRAHSKYGKVREVISDSDLTETELRSLFNGEEFIYSVSISDMNELINDDFNTRHYYSDSKIQSEYSLTEYIAEKHTDFLAAIEKMARKEFTDYFKIEGIHHGCTDFESVTVRRTPHGLRRVN